MPYQVDSSEGRCMYRGNDLELACEIYDAIPSAKLLISGSQDGEVLPERALILEHAAFPDGRLAGPQLREQAATSGRP